MYKSTQFLTVTLASNNGSITLDNSEGYKLLDGIRGIALPPREITQDPIPGGDGSMVRNVRWGSVTTGIPIAITGQSTDEVEAKRRRLESVVLGKNYRVEAHTQSTGRTWSLPGFYASGLEGRYGGSDSHFVWQHVTIESEHPSPAWLGEEVPETWFISQAAKPLVGGAGAFFPIVLQASTVAGEHTVTVSTDLPAFPVYTVAGPGDFLTITNHSTGQVFRLNREMTGIFTAITDPRVARISMTGVSAEELWKSVPPSDEPPILMPGENRISVQLTNANPDSTVRMVWRERRLVGH